MNLRKIAPYLLIAMSTLVITPVFASIGNNGTPTEKISTDAHSLQIEARIMEIKNMDKSHLSRQEKRDLRKELRQMRNNDKRKGIYISLGALIIIGVILLILLL